MKRSKPRKYSESDLMEFVRADFESLGYTTYAEVLYKNTGKRCDLYGRVEDTLNANFGTTIAFEAKLTFNMKVIEQAHFWKDKAHQVYIVVPTTYKDMSSRRFARKLCEALGIGVLEVNVAQNKYFMTVRCPVNSSPKFPTLYKEQKETLASNSSNNYVTPFKITVANINKYMEGRNSEMLTSLVKNVKHHYKSNMSAVNCIKNLVVMKAIKGYYITKEKNKIMLIKNGF